MYSNPKNKRSGYVSNSELINGYVEEQTELFKEGFKLDEMKENLKKINEGFENNIKEHFKK